MRMATDVNSDDVLRILNGLKPVDMSEWVICVITGRQSLRAQGLFEHGEVLVLDGPYGREPFGRGRKPAKWDTVEEHFTDLTEALACRDAVLAGTWTGKPRRKDQMA